MHDCEILTHFIEHHGDTWISEVVIYYTLAHFRWKPHIFQNYMVPEKFQSKNGKLYIFNFMAK